MRAVELRLALPEVGERELGEDALGRAVLDAIRDLPAVVHFVEHAQAMRDRERGRMERGRAREAEKRGPLLDDGHRDADLRERRALAGVRPDRAPATRTSVAASAATGGHVGTHVVRHFVRHFVSSHVICIILNTFRPGNLRAGFCGIPLVR